VAIDGNGSPVTTPKRLRALASFQRSAERDGDVSAVAGPGLIAGRLASFAHTQDLALGSGRAGGLGGRFSSLSSASLEAGRGILRGSQGAGEIQSALGTAGHGASSLSAGLSSAQRGSGVIVSGLERAGTGSDRLASGVDEATSGSRALATALRRARKRTDEASRGSGELIRALASGDSRLADLQGHLAPVEQQLLEAEQTLQRVSVESGDPGVATALRAVEAARQSVVGGDSGTGKQPGFGADVERARSQFSLGLYLANRMAKSQRRSRKGVRRLADSAVRFEEGLGGLSDHTHELASGVSRLAEAGSQLPSGLRRLGTGAGRLAEGLAQVEDGAGALAGGLANGEQRYRQLSRTLGLSPLGGEGDGSAPGTAPLEFLRQSPGFFRSPYFFLAGLDGSRPSRRSGTSLLINLEHGGTAARLFVIPESAPDDPRTLALGEQLQRQGAALARETGTDVAVGGIPANLADVNAYTRARAPLLRLALSLVTVLILLAVTRSLAIPIVAAFLNFVAVAASFGLLSLLFGTSLLGGPGYVDALVIPAMIMVMFGLAIDYEVFLLARMREEYVRTGSADIAVENGVARTAHVITGAALIMIVVFVAFAVSEFMTLRNFGVAQAIGVAIDAFIVRLVVMPAAIRGMGRWAWWAPRWLDRLLPGSTRPQTPPAF
jgi:RND superfamily putative drug exporter